MQHAPKLELNCCEAQEDSTWEHSWCLQEVLLSKGGSCTITWEKTQLRSATWGHGQGYIKGRFLNPCYFLETPSRVSCCRCHCICWGWESKVWGNSRILGSGSVVSKGSRESGAPPGLRDFTGLSVVCWFVVSILFSLQTTCHPCSESPPLLQSP